MKILKEGRIKLYQLEIIMSTWENMLNMNPMGNIPGVQLYRIPDYSQVEPQQSLDASGKEKQTLMDGVFNLSDLAFDPNSRRNIGATVMSDFANDSRFHCTRDADWYITSDDNKSRFIANLMIISVTQVFKNSNTPPLAFSVEYISSKNKNLLKDRQTVLVPFEKYISHSLHLAFYDLIGKLVSKTGLTRKDIVRILTGIEPLVFEQYKYNPEEFILKSAQLINEQKATAIIEHITYHALDDHYSTEVFTEPTIKGKLNVNAMKAQKHLYDYIVYDSTNEHDFAKELDTNKSVAVYVKLPNGFYISTPVGKYNPDWAIAFYEGSVKHIYFIAETKGDMSSMQLRDIEKGKIHCAKEHFKAISRDDVVYDVVDSYQSLLNIVTK